MEHLISIIVPVYNSSESIELCLKSICSQTYKTIEIIVVNDGSKDDSQQKIEKIVKLDQRIKLINQENKGLSSARNTGLLHSSGEFVYFCDSDDFLAEDTLEKLLDFCIVNNLELCEGYTVYKYENEIKPIVKISKDNCVLDSSELIYKFFLSEYRNISAWNKLIKRDFLIKNNITFIDRQISEDIIWLYQKILPQLTRAGYLKKGCYYYVKTGENTITRKHTYNHFYSYFNIFTELKNDTYFRSKVITYKSDIFSFLAMNLLKEFSHLENNSEKEFVRIYNLFKDVKELLFIGNIKRKIIIILFLYMPKKYSIKFFRRIGKLR